MQILTDSWKRCIKNVIIALILLLVFYALAGEQMKKTAVEVSVPEAAGYISPAYDGMVVEQSVFLKTDYIESVDVITKNSGTAGEGRIEFYIAGPDNEVIFSTDIPAQDCVDYAPYRVVMQEPLHVNKDSEYIFRFIFRGDIQKLPSLAFGPRAKTAHVQLAVEGEEKEGILCIGCRGYQTEVFGQFFNVFCAAVLLAVAAWTVLNERARARGKVTLPDTLRKYRFLIEQLVSRDFKVKYKRSVLGYFWSFLNPLLTMLVQYIVFSTLFRSGIKNYPVYLLSGNIIFSFFSEAVSTGLMAIVGNAPLISKVYVPKYIYPMTKVFSSAINLVISVGPLLIVAVMTGTGITPAVLLIPFALVCLLIFCLGMVFLLSAINVFFRDTQYLWGIISLIWMYATPIFYPAEIIPERLRFIQTWNPLFHVISFVRSVLIDGISPRPQTYLFCAASALISLLIGTFVFKKAEGRFALYI